MSLDPNDPLEFYLQELGTVRPLTKDEETDLLQHLGTQDELAESAASRLIEANLSLVVPIAKRHTSACINVLDLIQHGNEVACWLSRPLTEALLAVFRLTPPPALWATS